MREFDSEFKGYNVVDYVDFKIGNRNKTKARCKHKKFCIDSNDNSVFCGDCEEKLDTFWVLQQMVQSQSLRDQRIEDSINELNTLLKTTLHLRAAKNVQTHLKSKRTLPACPHCKETMFAENFLNMPRVSKSLAEQKKLNSENK